VSSYPIAVKTYAVYWHVSCLLARLQNLKGSYFQPSLSVCVCVRVCVCLSVCLSVSDRHFYGSTFNVDRFWRNSVTRTLLWSSLAATIMAQSGRRGTARRIFENFKKILKNHRIRISKLWSIIFGVCVSGVFKKHSTRFEQNWRRGYILKFAIPATSRRSNAMRSQHQRVDVRI